MFSVTGEGTGSTSMSHNSSSWKPPPSPHTGACDVQYWRRGRLPMSPCRMNNGAAGNAMTPPVWDGTWTSVTPCEQMISSPPSTAEVSVDEMCSPFLYVFLLYYTAGLRFGTYLDICNTSSWRY